MAKTLENVGEASEEASLQQLVNEAENVALRIKDLEEQKRSIEQQIEELSEGRRSVIEKIIDGNKVGDNIIVVLSLPNGGLTTEDLKQIGLTVSGEKSISSAKIREHLEDSGWIDLGPRPYDHEDYDELEGQVWVKK